MTFVPRPAVDYMVQATMSADCSFRLDELGAAGKQWVRVQPQPAGKVSMCKAIDNFWSEIYAGAMLRVKFSRTHAHTTVATGKPLLLKPARLSVIDTMSAFFIGDMASM